MTEKVTTSEMFDWVERKLLSDEVSHEFRCSHRMIAGKAEPREIQVGSALKEFLLIVDQAPDRFRKLSAEVMASQKRERRHG